MSMSANEIVEAMEKMDNGERIKLLDILFQKHYDNGARQNPYGKTPSMEDRKARLEQGLDSVNEVISCLLKNKPVVETQFLNSNGLMEARNLIETVIYGKTIED